LEARNKSTRSVILAFEVVVTLEVLTSAGAILGNVVEMLDSRAIVALVIRNLAMVLSNVTKEAVVIRERVLGLPKVVVTVFCVRLIFVELALTVRKTREVEVDSDKTSGGTTIFAPEDKVARCV